jgi:hypothetical protein
LEQQLAQRQLEVDELKLSRHRAAIANLQLHTVLDDEEAALLPAREALAQRQSLSSSNPARLMSHHHPHVHPPAHANADPYGSSRQPLPDVASRWLEADPNSRPKTAKSMLSSLDGNLSDVLGMASETPFNLSFSRPPTAAHRAGPESILSTTSQDFDLLAFDDEDALAEAPTPLPPSLRVDDTLQGYNRAAQHPVYSEHSRPATAEQPTSVRDTATRSRRSATGPTNYNDLRDAVV